MYRLAEEEENRQEPAPRRRKKKEQAMEPNEMSPIVVRSRQERPDQSVLYVLDGRELLGVMGGMNPESLFHAHLLLGAAAAAGART